MIGNRSLQRVERRHLDDLRAGYLASDDFPEGGTKQWVVICDDQCRLRHALPSPGRL